MSNDMILKGHDLFASLNVNEMHKLSSFSSVKEFKKHEMVFEYNQSGSHFYILMEGLVYLQLPANPPEFNLTLSKIQKGELFGISPLLKSPRYTSSAQCFKDAKVLSVEAKPFRNLLQMNCSAGMDIINRVAHIYFTRYLDLITRLQNVVGQITLKH
ncbi:cyclic nucleotide-binding domain-containing protein [candidate division KSB1 bacterium]